jgi:hypothetical protein
MWFIDKYLNKLKRKDKPEVYIIHDELTKRLTLINKITREKILLVDDYGKLLHYPR